MLIVAKYSFTLSVIILNVVMLSAVVLNVVATTQPNDAQKNCLLKHSKVAS